jgi:hypothetical protein
MIQFDYRHFATHFELYEYTPEENWWGDPLNKDYPESEAVREIVGCEVAVDNPQQISNEVAELFIGERDGATVQFGDKTIEFTAATEDRSGLVRLDFEAKRPERSGAQRTISGLQFRII